MTDTTALTAMLDAARALHERDTGVDSRYCITCGNVETVTGYWPCATATALGATGLSEWAVPAIAPGPEPDTCGAIRTEPDNECSVPSSFNAFPCVMNTGHAGPHRDEDGDTW